MEGHRKFLGEGDLKAKILEANYEPKLEFPRGRKGGRCKTRNLLWGEYGYFLELHITRRNLVFITALGLKGLNKLWHS